MAKRGMNDGSQAPDLGTMLQLNAWGPTLQCIIGGAAHLGCAFCAAQPRESSALRTQAARSSLGFFLAAVAFRALRAAVVNNNKGPCCKTHC